MFAFLTTLTSLGLEYGFFYMEHGFITWSMDLLHFGHRRCVWESPYCVTCEEKWPMSAVPDNHCNAPASNANLSKHWWQAAVAGGPHFNCSWNATKIAPECCEGNMTGHFSKLAVIKAQNNGNFVNMRNVLIHTCNTSLRSFVMLFQKKKNLINC